MAIQTGSYRLAPDNATLRVRTGRHGAAANAGHDLIIEVGTWEATLNIGEDAGANSLELTADSTSLRVVAGVGGVHALGDDDKADIRTTIEKDVLKRTSIAFRSTGVLRTDTGGLTVTGDLTMGGACRPIAFVVSEDGGRVAGRATVKQSEWGIKPYSALGATLKVDDDVIVELEGSLPG